MTSIARSTQLAALNDPHRRAEVGKQLRATLIALIDLSLLGKQPHRSVAELRGWP